MASTPQGFLERAFDMRRSVELAEQVGDEVKAEFFREHFNKYIDAFEKLTGETLDVERY